jgi:hypothetical protein
MSAVQYAQPQRQTLYGQWVNPLAIGTYSRLIDFCAQPLARHPHIARASLWGARAVVGLTVVAPVVGTVQKAAWGAADLYKKAQNLISSPFNYNIRLPDF